MTLGEWTNSKYNQGHFKFFTYKYTYNGVTYGPSRVLLNTEKNKEVIHKYSETSCFKPSENTSVQYYTWSTRELPDNYTILDPCPHKYEEVSTTSTCTSAGITTYACEYCKETYQSETPANHKYTTNGICDICGANTCIIILDGISYYYEYNMTWEEWLVSEYNTSGYSIVTGFKDTDNGWTHPNMVMLMNPTKDRFIAHPYSDGSRFIPSKSTLIRSYSWTTMDLSITQYVPIE